MNHSVLAVVIALVTVQLILEITALVILARTPTARVHFGAKWPWLLIILFGGLVGAIVFLAAGRQPAPSTEAASSDRVQVDTFISELYGDQQS